MRKTVVITGATGFLGSNLAKQFIAEGYHVCAVIRPKSKHKNQLADHPQLEKVYCSLDQIADKAAELGKADAWFHFAWGGVNREEIDSPAVQQENIRQSLNCVRAAQIMGCRIFMDAGSRVEYGIAGQVMSEDITCHPVNEYGKAKLQFYSEAKRLCESLKLSFYHLRFFSVYGFGDHPWSLISTLLSKLSTDQTISLSACEHLWNFMYIKDAVSAVYQLYRTADKSTAARIVNIASEDTRQLKAFVEEVKEIVGGQSELNYGTFVQAKEGALSVQPDIGVLKQLTKGEWNEQYTFRDGIMETLRKEME